jgi:hypothetical protein
VELAKSAIEFPPTQKRARFAMEAVAAQIRAAIAKRPRDQVAGEAAQDE